MHKQTNLFVKSIFNLEYYKKIKAYEILKVLYYKSEEGLNLEQLYLIFNNKKRKLIKSIISELDVGFIICKKKKNIDKEQRYFITNEGIEFLYDHLFDIR